MPAKVLIIEDDPIVSKSLQALLSKDGYEVQGAEDGPEGLKLARANTFQAIVLDISLPSMSGLEVLAQLRKNLCTAPVIILTAHGSVQNAVAALKAGAIDFLIKPSPPRELKAILKGIIAGKKAAPETTEPGRLVGESETMRRIRALIEKIAPTDANVYIYGETGTGKNLVAQAIHNFSKRKHKPFIKIDCATLPPELLESELFGHERGAFTGAHEQFIGKFEQAHGGTVFLDEISNLTLPVQAKLLNVVQERKFTRLKGAKSIEIDIRIVSASNKDLKELIKEGHFRQDLFYRLDVVPVNLPNLKEYKEDIPVLCDYFLNRFCKLHGKSEMKIEDNALKCITNYDFPGNIRELENLIEQLVVVTDSELITAKDLPSKIKQAPMSPGSLPSAPAVSGTLEDSRKDSEKETILNALKQSRGSKQKAAEILQISRVSLYNKIKKYNIDS